ncbi:MAG: Smr/MutS family protein [Novosphingobium sp.]|jgi:DNA-nicking Smr family endonuclease|nr:Smr/MutS family protein [Novosphingobium sp.]MBP6555463.1 Smr/MutS family protein [Novosphingobium sp.]
MRPPRGLSREEAELWGRVARTVKPLMRRVPTTTVMGAHVRDSEVTPPPTTPPKFQKIKRVPPQQAAASQLPQGGEDRKPRPLDRHGLDGSWERKLAKAEISPDFTLDLHGHTLDAAHARLDHGLAQAVSLGARLVLVITGKPRPVEAADRGGRRGAIRAKLLDWLAHGSHASRIAAVRGAHPRHGGTGAVYVVLKRPR